MENGDRQIHLQQAARKVFETRAGRELSDEDVRKITHNLVGFFRVLSEWACEADGGETSNSPAFMPAQESPKESGRER